MIAISWNYQGVVKASTVCELKELKVVHHPNLLFLIETKEEQKKLENLRR